MKKCTSSYGWYKTRYLNCSYLSSLLGKINLQSFEISYEKFSLLWKKRLPLLSATLQQGPHLKA